MYNAGVDVAQSGGFVGRWVTHGHVCVSSPHNSSRGGRDKMPCTGYQMMKRNRFIIGMSSNRVTRRSANGGHQMLARSNNQSISNKWPPALQLVARRRQSSSCQDATLYLSKQSTVVKAAATAAMGSDESPRMSLKDLQDLIGEDWWLFAACFLANIVSVIAYVLVAPSLGHVIDVISTKGSTYVCLAKAVGALGLAYLLSNAALAAQVSLAMAAGERLASHIRSRLFSSLMFRDTYNNSNYYDNDEELGDASAAAAVSAVKTTSNHTSNDTNKSIDVEIATNDGSAWSGKTLSTGTLISWLGNDVEILQTTVTKLLGAKGIRAALETVGIICVLLWLNWLLALTLLVSAPVLTPLVLSAASRIRHCSEKVQEATSQASSVANEIIENQKIVKVNQAEESQQNRFFRLVDRQSSLSHKLIGISALLDISGRLRNVICVLITVGLGAHLALMNQVSVGTCYSFFIYSFGFSFALSNLTQSFGEISKVIGTMKHVSKLLKTCEQEANSPSDSKDNDVFSSFSQNNAKIRNFKIEFRNVSFTHPDGWSMDSISFVMHPHTTTALVGPSGGGKSTLAALLLGVYRPTSGEMLVDGVPLSQIDPKWWKSQIGMVEQQPGLLVGKVADIVSYGNNNASKDDVLRVLEQTQAYEFVQNLPDGIDTLVGGDGVGISGGQAQRLALARALLRKPSVLILDEATSALDVHTESAVTSEYLALGDESPNVLVIAHRLSTVRNADTIVVIVDGRVEEMGSHNDLLIRHPNGVYAKLVSASSSSSSALA